MSFLRKGVRRRGRVATALTTVGALAAFQVLAIIGAGAASAVTGCTYNLATGTINITIDPGEDRGVAVERRERPRPGVACRRDPVQRRLDGFETVLQHAVRERQRTRTHVRSSSSARRATMRNSTSTRRWNGGGTFNTAIAWAVDIGLEHVGDFDDVVLLADGTATTTTRSR